MRTLFRATDRLFRTTDREFLIVECARCRLVRLYPQPTPLELKEYYPDGFWCATGTEQTDFLLESYWRLVQWDHVRFVKQALEHAGEAGAILDVGCGGGLLLKSLRSTGRPMAGLDFSLDAATVAWGTNRVPAVCAKLSQAPFRPESCALITMLNVLEHLYDPVSYLESAREILKPDGRLVVQVPNAACWQFLFFGEAWSGVGVPRHVILFKDRDLFALLDHCGFEIVRKKYFSLRDNPAGFASSLAVSLDPVARRLRKVKETPRVKLLKDLLHFGLTLVALPFTLLEAACHAGSTILVEARRKK